MGVRGVCVKKCSLCYSWVRVRVKGGADSRGSPAGGFHPGLHHHLLDHLQCVGEGLHVLGKQERVVRTLAQGAVCSEKVREIHGLAWDSVGLGSRMGGRLGLGKVSLT